MPKGNPKPCKLRPAGTSKKVLVEDHKKKMQSKDRTNKWRRT